MSFFRPIWFGQYHGVEVARVDVPLTVLSATGEVDQGFRFDTVAYITTVSEDVAAACGLPAGGTLIHVAGVGGQVAGRLVDVRFRFPPDTLSGADGSKLMPNGS